MKIIPLLLLLITTSSPFFSSAAQGGLSLSQTRVVFPGDKSSVSLNVRNSSAEDIWLLRGWVEDIKGAKQSDTFIVTPPLYRLDPNNNIQLRINALDVKYLPINKESVFYLNVMAIPPRANDDFITKKNSSISFSVNNRIKMFYRPISIDDRRSVIQAYGEITARQQGKEVVLFNPSPYYITLDGLHVNKRDVQGTSRDYMLSPEGNLSINYSGKAENISYQVIDDYGGKTETYHINL